MSIIFQKLKTLKEKSSVQDDMQQPRLQQGKNFYTFRRLIFSPMGAFLIFAVIMGFGLISFYSLSFLKNYLDSGSSKAIVIQHPQSHLPGDIDTPPHMDGIPEPPPGSEVSANSKSSSNTGSKKPEKLKIPEYFVYQAKTVSEPLNIPGAPKNYFIPSLKSVYNTPAKKTKTPDQLDPVIVPDTSPSTIETVSRNGALESTANKPLQQQATSTTPTIKPVSEPVKQKENTPTPASNSQKMISQEAKKEARQEVIRLANKKKIRKISTIASLAAELENATNENDTARMDKLIAQLAQIKDNNSLYYLKLKAFKEIREENYDLARKLLNKVLAKNKNDFEASINMAIIEIRQHNFENARQKLIKLKERYPSKTFIDDLLNML